MGQAACAQSIFQRQEQFRQTLESIEMRRQNTITAINEASDLKTEARRYYEKNNRKLACLTIEQAYQLELQAGFSDSSTRATIRKYCG